MTHAHEHRPDPVTPVDTDISLDDALLETEEWESGYADDSPDGWDGVDPEETSGDYDLAARHALRRVAGLSTELEDISEVEYRQLRLERVVLVGVWTEGTVEDAENSMAELALLAETAGSQVLDAFFQRRQKPDPATYIGRGTTYTVDVPGGTLEVTWTADDRVLLTGPAVLVAEGYWLAAR